MYLNQIYKSDDRYGDNYPHDGCRTPVPTPYQPSYKKKCQHNTGYADSIYTTVYFGYSGRAFILFVSVKIEWRRFVDMFHKIDSFWSFGYGGINEGSRYCLFSPENKGKNDVCFLFDVLRTKII